MTEFFKEKITKSLKEIQENTNSVRKWIKLLKKSMKKQTVAGNEWKY